MNNKTRTTFTGPLRADVCTVYTDKGQTNEIRALDEVERAVDLHDGRKQGSKIGRFYCRVLTISFHWDVLGPRVTTAALDFLNAGVLPDGINHTTIVLIPKIKDTPLSDSRPSPRARLLSAKASRLISPGEGAFTKSRWGPSRRICAERLSWLSTQTLSRVTSGHTVTSGVHFFAESRGPGSRQRRLLRREPWTWLTTQKAPSPRAVDHALG